jgi:hypothetical protein
MIVMLLRGVGQCHAQRLSGSQRQIRPSCASCMSSALIEHCYAGSATGAGAALPRIRSEPFSAITMVAE